MECLVNILFRNSTCTAKETARTERITRGWCNKLDVCSSTSGAINRYQLKSTEALAWSERAWVTPQHTVSALSRIRSIAIAWDEAWHQQPAAHPSTRAPLIPNSFRLFSVRRVGEGAAWTPRVTVISRRAKAPLPFYHCMCVGGSGISELGVLLQLRFIFLSQGYFCMLGAVDVVVGFKFQNMDSGVACSKTNWRVLHDRSKHHFNYERKPRRFFFRRILAWMCWSYDEASMKYPRIPRVARGYPQDAANFDRGKRSGYPRIRSRNTVQECELGSEGAFRSKTCKLPRFHPAAISPVDFRKRIMLVSNHRNMRQATPFQYLWIP